MAINPQILIALLSQQAPQLLKAFKTLYTQTGDPVTPYINGYLRDGYDPILMANAIASGNDSGYDDEFLGYPGIAPTTRKYGADFGLAGDPILKTSKVLSAPKETLEKIYANANDAPALQSAISMLRENPLIGTRNDPEMLARENIYQGLTFSQNNNYNPAPKLFEGAAYTGNSLFSDDNPDDELSKLAKRLIRGY